MKGILIIRGGAIGDFVCTLPVAAAIRKALPQTPLSLLSYDRVLPLARASGLFDETRSLESRAFAGFFADRGDLDDEWYEYFGSFGMILSFLFDPDGILRRNLERCDARSVFGLDPRPADRHVSRHLCSILSQAGLFTDRFVPELRLASRAPAPGPAPVAIHPGSGSESKNWRIEAWEEIIRHLAGLGMPVVLIGGEADEDRLRRLEPAFAGSGIEVLRQQPLLSVAQRLATARLFIGHDSGITHLAAALDVPTLALFGPSNPLLWGPQGSRVRILRQNRVWNPDGPEPDGEISVDDISPELVKAEVERMLAQKVEAKS